MMQAIFDQYGWENAIAIPLSQGLINQTYELQTAQGANIKSIGQYYNTTVPDQLYTHLVPNLRGETLIECEGKYYRAFKKIEGFALDVLTNADQAKEAAHQFGKFTFKVPSI